MVMPRSLLGWPRLLLAASLVALVLVGGTGSVQTPEASAQATLQVSAGGPYSGQVGQSILFTAQAFGATLGSQVTYVWNFGDGGSATGQSVTHAYVSAGTFSVTVFAQSTSGQTGSAVTTAQVGGVQGGAIQVFAGGPYSGVAGTPILFTAQASLNGVPLTTQAQFRWTFSDGTSAFGQSTSKAFLTAGAYTATVTVTATTGQTGTSSASVQIGGSTQTGALQVNAGGPYVGQVGTPVTFAAQLVLNGVLVTTQAQYSWNFGDGTTGFGQTTAKTYASAGTFTVSVSASLSTGQSGVGTTTVQIGGGAQTGALQVSAGGPYTAAVGQPVTLSAVAPNVPVGTAVNYIWTFSDGTTAAGQTVSKTFNAPGTVTATVNVTTTGGLTGTATTTVNVGGSSTTPSGATETISLFAACNNVAVTWPNGTAMSVVAAAISPPNALIAIWRFDNLRQTFVGYSSLPGAPNDLNAVNRAEPVFVCMNGSGSMTRPVI
jgi:large repetitive protein